jgi:hypothetical protein
VLVSVVLIVGLGVFVGVKFFVVGCGGFLLRLWMIVWSLLFVRGLRLSRWSIGCLEGLDFLWGVSFKGFID